MKKQETVPADIRNVALGGGFWSRVAEDVRKKVIPYQWEALNDRVEGAEPSYCVHNFQVAAGMKEGEFGGMVFQDSDLAKWIEAVAYSLSTHPDPELEKTADGIIDTIEKAQQPDGYLNTYFTVKAPERRWSDLRDCHELYCAGHMMEAAVAYYEATGKRKLLDVMHRMAKLIMEIFGPEQGKIKGYPGHQEIELALVRMYHATGDADLLRLAKYFLDERGSGPNYFAEEDKSLDHHHFRQNDALDSSYNQSHLPVREQKTIEGHSVRALYMLAGMADVARETGDVALFEACETLFENVSSKRMYVTGGVGSTHIGEAFTFDYDLPNDTIYAETCASIALVFFAQRMLQIDPDAKYAQVMERALYNTCIAGMSLDGRSFFYVNPLEVQPEASEKDPAKKHVLPLRPKWFGCSCCPPNLARLVSSLGQYIYSTDEKGVYVHLFIDSKADLQAGGQKISLAQSTEYPYDGRISFTASAGKYLLRLRLPDWCQSYTLTVAGAAFDAPVEKGYLVIDRAWSEGESVELSLDMPPRRVYAHPSVAEDVGKVAIMRGPLVYCAEEADNGKGLYSLRLAADAALSIKEEKNLLGGVTTLHAPAERLRPEAGGPLYRDQAPDWEAVDDLTMIPYYAWANRGKGEMTVWMLEK